MPSLFPFADYWWFYLSFTVFVFAVLALDLGVFHKNAHVVSFKEASIWSVIWIALALVFNWGLHEYASYQFLNSERLTALPGYTAALANQWADQISLEFLTGYVIEKALSVDNLFIFVIVFQFFAIKPEHQHRILFYGILGALFFRAVFISIGAALMQYEWIIILFGVFLVATGVKLAFAKSEEIEPEKNILVRLLRKLMPVTTENHGSKFFARINGRWHATPMLLCLVFIEATDIIFAVDSVPAIFAITKEPLIVFTSNIFAILGLRSLYFLLANVVDRFHMLKYGLAVVLVFVGLKMSWLNHAFGGKFPITWSLGIIFGVIGVSVIASLLFPKRPTVAAGS